MKSNHFKFAKLLFALVLLSCTGIEDVTDVELNVLKLEVGQKFKYVLLLGEKYSSQNHYDFVYTGDTLELEVLDFEIPNKYLISERITAYSNMMVNDDSYYWDNKNDVYHYNWIVQNDSLYFKNLNVNNSSLGSRLLVSSKLSLTEFDKTEVDIIGWKTSFQYYEGDIELYSRNFTLFNNYYDRLNVYLNNSPMASDGNGRTIIYSKEHGIIKTSTYSWWTGKGLGWDRIN